LPLVDEGWKHTPSLRPRTKPYDVTIFMATNAWYTSPRSAAATTFVSRSYGKSMSAVAPMRQHAERKRGRLIFMPVV
jgi:hypothetical protein